MIKLRKKVTFIFLSLLVAGSMHASTPKYMYGVASWYGEDYAMKTASGDVYDANKLTAAHRSLPIGTVVRLVNMDNEKTVDVTINDRGPLAQNQMIQVSKKAAIRLDFLETGTAYVKMSILHMGKGMKKIVEEPQEQTKTPPMVKDDISNTNGKVSDDDMRRLDELDQLGNDFNDVQFANEGNQNVVDLMPSEAKEEIDVKEEDVLYKIDDGAAKNDGFILDEKILDDLPTYVQMANDITEEDAKNIPVESDDDNTKGASTEDFVVDFNPEDINLDALLSDEVIVLTEEEEIQEEAKKSTYVPVSMPKKEAVPETQIAAPVPVKEQTPAKATTENIINTTSDTGSYFIQVGAFKNFDNAQNLYNSLLNEGYNVFTSDANVDGVYFTRVRVGYFKTYADAQNTQNILSQKGLPSMLVEVK